MKSLLLFLLAVSTTVLAYSQSTWSQKGNFPGGKRFGCVAIGVSDIGYAGLGSNGSTTFKDWWQYNPLTDQWTAKKTFPGSARYMSTAIAIDGIVYVGLGTTFNFSLLNDWWAYDPVADNWVQKASLPSAGRHGVSSFVVDGKGYICLGNKGTAFGPYSNQLWQYDPVTDSWALKANFPGIHRYQGIGFSIGDKGYVGLGVKKNQGGIYKYYKDLWEYDPVTDSWTEKADYPQVKCYPAVFVINNMGYVGLGHNNATFPSTFFAYDPNTDSWSLAKPFPGTPRAVQFSFAINGKGYLGTGLSSSGTYLEDFWELNLSAEKLEQKAIAESECLLKTFVANNSIQFELNGELEGSDVQLELYDLYGTLKYSETFSKEQVIKISSGISTGIYITILKVNGIEECSRKIFIP